MNPNHRKILIALTIGLTLTAFAVHLHNSRKPPKNDFPYMDNGSITQPFPINPNPEPIETEPQKPEWELNIGEVKEENVKRHVYYLASQELEGRMSGKSGHKKAVDYAENEFKKYGLNTFRQKFSIRRMNNGPKNESGDTFTENLYAYIPGKTDEVVVVGAHIDHIGYGPMMSRSTQEAVHPGADDNASGVAVVLETARILAGSTPNRGIVFQLYSGEEMGLLGSIHYVNNPMFPPENPNIRKHVAMINYDMVGFLSRNTVKAEVSPSSELRGSVQELSSKYTFIKNLSNIGGGSDHATFHNMQIPVVFLNTGLHNFYHTPQDTPDKLDYPGLAKITQFSCELTWSVANDIQRVSINTMDWSELPYSHDHGYNLMPFPVDEKFFPHLH